MSKLYELATAYQDLSELDPDAFSIAIEAIEEQAEVKVETLIKVMRELEAEAKMFDDEAERLKTAGSVHKNKAERIKTYIKQVMEVMHKDKFKGVLFTVSLHDSPPACAIEDKQLIPEEYLKTTLVIDIDKKGIIENWKKTGAQVPGAVVGQSKHIRIKP